jgi:uncharacterized protein (DUF1697 family)
MVRCVALLRGVNVGGARRVPMAEWRVLMEGLGYTAVRTLLNSGNAVFDSSARGKPDHAARIRRALLEQLAVEVPVIVKTAQQMLDIAACNPLAGADVDAARLLVAFALDTATLQGLAPIAALTQPPEQLHIGAHAAYLHCANGILQSKAGEALLGKAGRAVTSRNWATVQKILALLD